MWVVEVLQQLADRHRIGGYLEARSDVGQRCEIETSLPQAGVGDTQLLCLENLVAVDQQIYVEGSGAEARTTSSACSPLQGLGQAQELIGGEPCTACYGGIEIWILGDGRDRLTAVGRGDD
jgi:hypothetical protein